MLIVVIIGVIILWGFLSAWGQEMRFKASAAPPDLSFWLLSCLQNWGYLEQEGQPGEPAPVHLHGQWPWRVEV